MPWDILGLDAEKADKKSVKRAYARLIRQHRPDDDPAGFQVVHDAYQQALFLLDLPHSYEFDESNSVDVAELLHDEPDEEHLPRGGEYPFDATVAVEDFGNQLNDVEDDLSDELSVLNDLLKELLTSSGATELEKTKVYESFFYYIFDHPEEEDLWIELLKYHDANHGMEIISNISPQCVIALFQQGTGIASMWAARRLIETRNYSHINEIVNLIKKEGVIFSHEDAGQICFDFAMCLSLWNATAAHYMTNLSYELCAPEDRWRFDELDTYLLCGRDMCAVNESSRRFWSDVIVFNDEIDFGTPSFRSRLQNTLSSLPENGVALGFIKDLVPSSVFDRAEKKVNSRQGGPSRYTGKKKSKKEDSSGWSGCMTAVIFFLIIKFLITASQCSTSGSHDLSRTPTNYNRSYQYGEMFDKNNRPPTLWKEVLRKNTYETQGLQNNRDVVPEHSPNKEFRDVMYSPLKPTAVAPQRPVK